MPGALLVFLSFRAGGLFAGTTALLAVLLAGLIVVRVAFAADPFAGMSVGLAVAIAALCLYAAWTLISASWSESPGRALVEFDRTLAYLFALVLFGSFARTAASMRWIVRGLAAATAAVCMAGFVSRTLPDLWSAPASALSPDRLSAPLTYWNGVGMIAAVGFILCFYLSSGDREPRSARILAAAALPLVAATLLLTFSRGAIAACVLGLLAYVLLARPKALPGALVAGAPTVAVALVATYRADEVAAGQMSRGAIEQGYHLSLLVVACVGAAAASRALTLRLDRATRLLPRGMVRVTPLIVGLMMLVAVGAGLAAGAGGFIERQYDRFVEGHVEETHVRDRLAQVGSRGRISHWKVAIEGFHRNKLHGEGAGTYPVLWNRYRPSSFNATEAHSLYLEALGELGMVGLVLLLACLAALVAGTAAKTRGPDGAVYGALLGAILAWAAYAGIDWLWELPAATLWVFCAGAAALAATPKADARDARHALRVVIALGVLILAATPALVGRSQQQLNASIRALQRGDCARAVGAASDSISTLSVRAEPYEVLGYCSARAGRARRAIAAFEAAVRRDPKNWELYYGLALVRAVGGSDPRSAARTALRLNPRSRSAEVAARKFSAGSPGSWRRVAGTMPIAIP